MNKITARIVPDEKNSEALWLFVDREGEAEVSDLLHILGAHRSEDDAGQVAYPVLHEEIEAIRDACNDYLKSNKHD